MTDSGELGRPGQRSPDLGKGDAGPAHLVQFYDNDEALLERVATFVRAGLEGGDFVIAIVTEAHAAALEDRLGSVTGSKASDQARVLFFDADAMLSKFMRNGEPDPLLFEAEVGGVIAERVRAAGAAKVRAFGEMVNVLWQEGQRNSALRLEELWNDLQTRHRFTLLCAYAISNFFKQPAELQRVCAAHTHVLEREVTADTALPPQYARRLAREIAHREEVEVALRDSLREMRAKDEELRDFLENASIGMHRVGADGRILWANRAELEMLGYAENEYVGRPIAEFHVDEPVISDILERLACGETLHEVEARVRAKDGTIRHVLINSSVYTRDGKFIHTRCFTRDITERRRAEEARSRSEEQFRIVTDALPVLVSYVDTDGRYQFVSAAYERWFGRPREDILGKHLSELLGSEGYAKTQPHVERALRGESVAFEEDVRYADGRTRSIEATYIPQRSPGGVAGFVALVSDVSERKRLERFRAAAAARAERLWKVTAAIAHAVSSEQVYEALVDRIYEMLGATSVALWLAEEDGLNVRLARQKGYAEATAERFVRLRLSDSPSIPAADCIRLGEPIWVRSQAELLEQYPHLAPSVTPGVSYRISCLPLVVRGRVLGALALTTDAAREDVDEERDFLLLAARYASQAVERLRLLELERRSRADADDAARRMGVLSHATRAFVETGLELDARLHGVVLELGKTLGSSVEIALLEDGLLHTCAVHHPVPQAEARLRQLAQASPLRAGEGVSGAVAVSGESVLIPSIEVTELIERTAPSYRAFLEQYPVYAMLCAPLHSRSGIIGVVTVSRTNEGETYTGADLELLEELASRAAGAIDNSRLYHEAEEARRRAEQLYNFAEAVAVADNVNVVFDAALTAIAGALGTDRVAILTLDGRKSMRFVAWRGLSERYRAAVEGHSPWSPDATSPAPVLVPDAAGDDSLRSYVDLFHEESIGALGFLPLVNRERLLGKFMVYYPSPHQFANHEVELALAIANHLASVIARFSAVAALEETLRANELFAGVLAHDLQNPLSAMMMAAQVMLMRNEGDPAARPVSKILSSGKRMARMIEQLLDFTRARTGGGIQIQPRETHLGELSAQAVDELELAHPEWTIRCDASGDLGVCWDPDRMVQVISNLVANAGQHGAQGSPVIVRLDGSSESEVKFEIHNAGAIPPKFLPNIFDPFRSHRGAHVRGLGLGLFIVRQIVLAHGGTVTVSSSEEAGTTFHVTVPRAVRPLVDAPSGRMN